MQVAKLLKCIVRPAVRTVYWVAGWEVAAAALPASAAAAAAAAAVVVNSSQ